jgi:hypothetical protein
LDPSSCSATARSGRRPPLPHPGGGTVCNVARVTADEPSVWRDLEVGAPQLARLGFTRLNAARVALLGTLRRSGAPRISPIEPYFVEGELLVGVMTWSQKADDLRRDPRYVLHSAITHPDSGEGECKLSGQAVEVGQELRGLAAEAWWSSWPPDKAIVFSLHINHAVFIEWVTDEGLMTVHRWSPQRGYSQRTRTYP